MRTLIPQGWAFFTRSSREQALLFYKKEKKKWILVNSSGGSYDKLFGLSRLSRRQQLRKIDSFIIEIAQANPFGNVYGMARSVLASGTFLTLLANPIENLFFADGLARMGNASELLNISLFTILKNHLEIARIVAIFALLLVIIGYRPRCLVSFFFSTAAALILYLRPLDKPFNLKLSKRNA